VDDLLAPEVIADPYPTLAAIREEDPVHWSEPHKAWLITRYEDVTAALLNPVFSSNRISTLLDALDDEKRARVGPVYELMAKWLVLHDRPEHTRLRRLVTVAFQPKRVARMEDRIRALVDELLDEFIAAGHTDFVKHFAFPFPATVICELVGAPPEHRDQFGEWSNEMALVAFSGPDTPGDDRHARAQRGVESLIAYFDDLIEQRKDTPGDDMISGLLEGDGQGNVLTREEMTGMLTLVLFAGHETTTNLLSGLVKTLDRHPDQYDLLRRDPDLVPGAVEEMLRYDGPVKLVVRYVSEDVELGGKTLRRGDRAFMVLAAANRDPEKFAEPDRFDITRSPNPHLGFGRGIHTCLGAQLARLETRVALTRILERLPGLRLAQEPEYLPSRDSRAFKEVHVTHDAR